MRRWIYGIAAILLSSAAGALATFISGVPVDSGSGQWVIPFLCAVVVALFIASFGFVGLALRSRADGI